MVGEVGPNELGSAVEAHGVRCPVLQGQAVEDIDNADGAITMDRQGFTGELIDHVQHLHRGPVGGGAKVYRPDHPRGARQARDRRVFWPNPLSLTTMSPSIGSGFRGAGCRGWGEENAACISRRCMNRLPSVWPHTLVIAILPRGVPIARASASKVLAGGNDRGADRGVVAKIHPVSLH